jgi:hypothetical protein
MTRTTLGGEALETIQRASGQLTSGVTVITTAVGGRLLG